MRVMLLLVAIFVGTDALAGEWKRLPALPDREGFAGPFAGVSNGALIVSGGANFPGKKPWDGGKKVWYDGVFVMEKPGGKWKLVDKLPRRLGYGVSVTHGEGVVCAGGSDADRHYADADPNLGWRLAFTACGVFGMLYAVPLVLLLRDAPKSEERLAAPRLSPVGAGRELLTNFSFILLVLYFTLPAMAGWCGTGCRRFSRNSSTSARVKRGWQQPCTGKSRPSSA